MEGYQDWVQMKELTILALSHLLNANVDAGLKYSLAMGYDDDQETRTAFIQVLTNILNQGTEFETLAENVMTERYEKLIDVSLLNRNGVSPEKKEKKLIPF
jgi:neurofibromin 1